ncbi:MAG: glycosyltransferase, partial [Gemmataceae bacterium]
FLVPPRQPRALAARILDLIRERAAARQMADRACELVRRELGLSAIVTRFAALYAELVCDSNQDHLGATNPAQRQQLTVSEA